MLNNLLTIQHQSKCSGLHNVKLALAFSVFLLSTGCTTNTLPSNNQIEVNNHVDTVKQAFFMNTMNSAPLIPADTSHKRIGCELAPANTQYKTSKQVDYGKIGWEERISHNTQFIDLPSSACRVLVIDMASLNDEIAYRYLSNDNSHEDLYEPWSSSKIFAYTGAIAHMRKHGIWRTS